MINTELLSYGLDRKPELNEFQPNILWFSSTHNKEGRSSKNQTIMSSKKIFKFEHHIQLKTYF